MVLTALSGAVLTAGRAGPADLEAAAVTSRTTTPMTLAARPRPALLEASVAAAPDTGLVAAPTAVPAPVVARPAAARSARAISPPPAEFDAPAEPAAPPPRQLARPAPAQPRGSGVWAVVIGIDNYPGSRSDLRSAVNDARDVDDALEQFGVPSGQRLLLTDRQASAATIRSSLDWLVGRAGPDATAVVFFAGHVRKLGPGREVLTAADGATVSDDELATRLRRLKAKTAWIAIAACFGGGFDEVLAPGRVLSAAADAASVAYENAALGRSYFVEYVVRRAMIEGAAPTSVQAAVAWATAELQRDYPDRVPFHLDRASQPIDLRTVKVSTPPVRSEPAPTAPAGASPPPAGDGIERDADGRTCGERTLGGVQICRADDAP